MGKALPCLKVHDLQMKTVSVENCKRETMPHENAPSADC